jgi:hypothetical protein
MPKPKKSELDNKRKKDALELALVLYDIYKESTENKTTP